MLFALAYALPCVCDWQDTKLPNSRSGKRVCTWMVCAEALISSWKVCTSKRYCETRRGIIFEWYYGVNLQVKTFYRNSIYSSTCFYFQWRFHKWLILSEHNKDEITIWRDYISNLLILWPLKKKKLHRILHWASKETYHFFRATLTKIHHIKMDHI